MSIIQRKQSVLLNIAATMLAVVFAYSAKGAAETATKKPVQFMVVTQGNSGDVHCLEPKTPCFIPTADKSVTVARYSASSVSGHPRSVSLTFDEVQGKEIAEIMTSHEGKRVALLVDGIVIQAPVVRTKVIDGRKIEVSSSSDEGAAVLKAALGISK